MAEAVEIDGSILEGGGQIVRNAVALSCLLSRRVHITKIREGRDKPGLRPQHLTGLQLMRDLSSGELIGGDIGSCDVTLSPCTLMAGEYTADTKTAGSVCLLLQTALPYLLFGGDVTSVCFKGGTNCEMAPQIDYVTEVLQPILEKFGVTFDLKIVRRGYYPRGGGEVRITAHPLTRLTPLDLTSPGKVVKITGRAWVAGALPPKVAYKMADAARGPLRQMWPGVSLKVAAYKEEDGMAIGNGNGIILVAETDTGCRIGASVMGKRGMPAERLGEEVAENLLRNVLYGGCVDEHLQDQVIIFMALASGKSRVLCGPLTLHTRTAIHVAQQITQARFTVTEEGENLNIIECEGIGLVNRFASAI